MHKIVKCFVRHLMLVRRGMKSDAHTSFMNCMRSDSLKHAYTLRLAKSEADLKAVQLLRFAVFNVEMGLGYGENHKDVIEEYAYDITCDHLMLERGGHVIGTYRLRVFSTGGEIEDSSCGKEFNLSNLKTLPANILELGRACIDRRHRSLEVFRLLWRGIIDYSILQKCRYFVGCTSVFTQNQLAACVLYSQLPEAFLGFGKWQIFPNENCACDDRFHESSQNVCSRLLDFYVTMGAKICGPPAIDKQFRTIDFLTYFDTCNVSLRAKQFLAKHAPNPLSSSSVLLYER